MSQQPKKKRVEDQPLGADAGLKPVQLQRRRVFRACESCRRKKIKCDGNEPLCNNCSNTKTQCTWSQTKDRAALSRYYVQELEARLLHMEEVFKQVAPVVQMLGNTPNGENVQAILSSIQQGNGLTQPAVPPVGIPNIPRERTLSEPSQSPPPRSSSSKSSRDEDDVSESFGQLALDERGNLRWMGGSSTMSLIQSFRAITTSPLHRISPMEEDPHSPSPSANKLYFPASVFFGKVHALPGPEDVEYPERDLADKLVTAYFDRLHFLLPVVDKPTFLNDYNYLMDHTDDKELAKEWAAFVALVFAVFACASRIVDDERLKDKDDGGLGLTYYERALILHYIDHAAIKITHVQCFILLSSFLCAVNCLPQAWLLTGQAVRMAQDLGLHRFSRHLDRRPVEKEVRRKVFWGVYQLDRMLALALGRPLGISDADCDAELPIACDDDDLQEYFDGGQMRGSQPPLMTGFIALCDLYRISGRICQQIYGIDKCKDNLESDKVAELVASAQELDKELTQWCEDLPAAFKSTPTTEAQVSMGAVLCSHYYSLLTTLHRNFLPVKRDHEYGPHSSLKAVHSARACMRLAPSVKNVVPPSHHLAFFIQQLFSSAVIILLYAMHIRDKDAARAAMVEAESCIDIVAGWEGVWPGARKCKELLSDLASNAREAINKASDSVHNQGEMQPYTNVSPLSAGTSPPATRRSVSRSNRGKTSRTKSRESRASLHRTTSPYRRRNASAKRPLDDFDHSDPPISGSPSSSSFHGGFPASFQGMNEQKPTIVDTQTTVPPEHGRRRSVAFLPDPIPFGPSLPSTSGSSAGPSLTYNYSQQDTQAPWSPTDPINGGMFANSSHEDYSTAFDPQTGMASNFMSYGNPLGAMLGITGQGDSPPSSSFPAQGLPFAGLDFIRNYTPGGYEDGQDGLWQGFDGGEFRYDPDIPFALGELTTDGNQHNQS